MRTPIERAKGALLGSPFTGAGFLEPYMPVSQRLALHLALQGEEAAGIAADVIKVIDQIHAAPKTYDQRDDGDDAIVHLHYFQGGSDWWIVELDVQDGVSQAFGYARLNGDDDMAEWGYVSITELVQNGVELDMHWTPKAFREARKPR